MCAADARFAIAKFLLTIGRFLLHCWYSLGRPVTIGTPMVIFTTTPMADVNNLRKTKNKLGLDYDHEAESSPLIPAAHTLTNFS